MAWVDGDHIALLAWDIGAKKSGRVYTEILRGPNAAEDRKRAVDGRSPSVSVLESGHYLSGKNRRRGSWWWMSGRMPLKLLRAEGFTTLSVLADGRFMKFDQEEPGVPGQAVSTYFAMATPDVDTAYMAVSRGYCDSRDRRASGAEVAASSMPEATSNLAPKADANVTPPRSDATWLSSAPVGGAALYTANASDGSHLWLCGGGRHPKSSCTEIWHANGWIQNIRPVASSQSPIRQPMVLRSLRGCYCRQTIRRHKPAYGRHRVPRLDVRRQAAVVFSLYKADFWEHPQLFAALGYAVLLPSMPHTKNQSINSRSCPMACFQQLMTQLRAELPIPTA